MHLIVNQGFSTIAEREKMAGLLRLIFKRKGML